MDSLLNLVLRSPDDIIDLASDLLNLSLTIKSSSHLVVSLDKALKLFLQTVVLVIEIGHMLVKSINLSLEINLVPQHLIGVILKSIKLITDRLFILVEFVEKNCALL